jgi:tetratricopeptide (TPR) repeat protein
VPFEKSAFKEQKEQLKIAVENLEKGNAIYILSTQNWSQAIPFYEAAYKFNPNNAELNYKLGDCYLNSNTKSKALPYFLSSYELNPMLQIDIFSKLVTVITIKANLMMP